MARGNGRKLPVDRWLFQQERLAAAGLLHFAVGQFSDLQLGGCGLRYAPQLTGGLQPVQKCSE